MMPTDEHRFASEVDALIGTVMITVIVVTAGLAAFAAFKSRWFEATIAVISALLANRRWSRRAHRSVRSCRRGARLSAGRSTDNGMAVRRCMLEMAWENNLREVRGEANGEIC